jgi:uncharacterized membrane protein
MNGAQLHLLLNHLPVIVPTIGAFVVVYALLFKSAEVKFVGAGLIVVGAICAIPAYLTGLQAESIVKNYPEVSRLLIEDHQTAAWIALIVLEVAGALNLGLVVCSHFKVRFVTQKRRFWIAGVAVTLISSVVVARAAHMGGLIRHEEIRTTDRF